LPAALAHPRGFVGFVGVFCRGEYFFSRPRELQEGGFGGFDGFDGSF